MATEVYTTEDIKLRDGKEVTLRPLPIAELRKFMKIWNAFLAYIEENREKHRKGEEYDSPDAVMDKQFDVFHELTCLSLEDVLKGDKSDEEYSTYIGKTLDEITIMRVLNRCGGLNLEDPKLQEAALAEAMSQIQEDGQN